MSNIGMEQHDKPVFWQEEDEHQNLCFWWNNPYCNGKKEKIAILFWPEHPVEVTEAIEALYESLELRVKVEADARQSEGVCPTCKGHRQVIEYFKGARAYKQCPNCQGTGKADATKEKR